MEKYTVETSIASYQTDQFGKVSLCSLLQLMLESAWFDSQRHNIGFKQLKSKNLLWVLSRLYVEVDHYPLWLDKISIKTWYSGTDGIYAFREYLITDENGKTLLKANSLWLVLDNDTRKVILLKNFNDFPAPNGGYVCRLPMKIRLKGKTEVSNYSPILFSDLDVNKHLNSVKSLERIIDNFGIDFLNKNSIKSLEINYLKEGHGGDFLAVSVNKKDENIYAGSLIRQSDSADLISVILKWRERKVTEGEKQNI